MRERKKERKKERHPSGGIRTHDTLHSGQMLLPTELPRQLSWQGPNQTSHSYTCTCIS